jgi:hypothetical protein
MQDKCFYICIKVEISIFLQLKIVKMEFLEKIIQGFGGELLRENGPHLMNYFM